MRPASAWVGLKAQSPRRPRRFWGDARRMIVRHSVPYYSPSSRWAPPKATLTAPSPVRVWDTSTGKQLAVLSGHTDGVVNAAYSADGKRIVSASFDNTARVWDARTGAQVGVLSGHTDSVQDAVYSSDGTRIVTASSDETAPIWDARTSEPLAVLVGHNGFVVYAAYSPDGNHVVTTSWDKSARIWDAEVPANIPGQIMWAASAEIDQLPAVERARLGLSGDSSAVSRLS